MPFERQVLGRGLDQLLGRGTQEQEKWPPPRGPSSLENKVLSIDVEKIKPDPLQPRKFFDEKAIKDLAVSIKEQGLLQPIVVSAEAKGYTIIAGERRWRAVQQLGWSRVPVLVKREAKNQSKKMTLALVENLQRQNLSPIESARAFAWLLKTKRWNQKDLADKIGWDRSSIANTIRLLSLHPEAQQLLLKNKISFSIAKLLLQEKSLEKQKIWARLASLNRLTVRELEQKIKKTSTAEIKTSFRNKTPLPMWLIEGCNRLNRKWNLDASLRTSSKQSRLEISFSDPEQLREFMSHV